MTIFRTSALLFVSTFALACGAGDAGDEDDSEGALKNNAGSNVNAHFVTFSECAKTHQKAGETADATNEMIQVEASFTDCVKKANDAAVAKIDKKLGDNRSPLKGKTAATLKAFRTASEALCTESDKASSNFGGTLSNIEAAGCRSTRESFLANLIDAYADLGNESTKVDDDRRNHAACYAQYDRAAETANSTAAMIEVSSQLLACIQARLDAVAKPIAETEVENNSAEGTVDAVTARVRSVTKAMVDQGGEVCGLLNQAGDNGGGTLANVTAAGCTVHVAESVYTELQNDLGETL